LRRTFKFSAKKALLFFFSNLLQTNKEEMKNNNNNNNDDDKEEDEEHPSMKLTDAQAEMYDRQLRVWGVSTQLKIAKARVLILGVESPTLLECAKNIVLAGVSKVILCRGKAKEEEEEETLSFLVSVEDRAKKISVAEAAAKSLQEMNPFGQVTSADFKFEDLEEDKYAASAILGENYDVVICCGRRVHANTVKHLNEVCRERKIAFFLTESSSNHGYFFSDLGDAFEFMERKKHDSDNNEDGKESALLTKPFESFGSAIQKTSFANFKPKRSCKFTPIFCALKQLELTENLKPTLEEVVDGVFLEDLALFLDNRIEMPAIAAIVGGLLANEVIKSISHAEEPVCNFFCFDVLSGKGAVEKLG
jgi:molybdopterin/thiamine biosynthesis adenylyltransferase